LFAEQAMPLSCRKPPSLTHPSPQTLTHPGDKVLLLTL
jgi:hypothetical protein